MDSSGNNMVENLLTSDDVAGTSEGNIRNPGLYFLFLFVCLRFRSNQGLMKPLNMQFQSFLFLTLNLT